MRAQADEHPTSLVVMFDDGGCWKSFQPSRADDLAVLMELTEEDDATRKKSRQRFRRTKVRDR